jgi:hypothetical protein
MADLEPRVNQLEEDVAILKGEIKSVLLEVRTTLLSQSNPFTGSAFQNPTPPPAPPAPAAPAPAAPPAANHQVEHANLFFENATAFFPEEPRQDAGRTQQTQNNNGLSFTAPAAAPQPQPVAQPQQQLPQPIQLVEQQPAVVIAPQQPVPLPVAPRRSWELNTLAMLLAWCQGNMVRLSNKEMTSLLSLARYGGLVDEELAGILLDISGSFDVGKEGRAATVSEYLLALHELHTVVKDEEEPSKKLRLVG